MLVHKLHYFFNSGRSRSFAIAAFCLLFSVSARAQEDTAYIGKELRKADALYAQYEKGMHSDKKIFSELENIYSALYKKYPASFTVNYSFGALYYNEGIFYKSLGGKEEN